MFWDSVLPATGVMFVLFTVIGLGIFLLTGEGVNYNRATVRLIIGGMLVVLGVSFIFACFGWGVGQDNG